MGYPVCFMPVPCSPDCTFGTCNERTGHCVCPPHRTGETSPRSVCRFPWLGGSFLFFCFSFGRRGVSVPLKTHPYLGYDFMKPGGIFSGVSFLCRALLSRMCAWIFRTALQSCEVRGCRLCMFFLCSVWVVCVFVCLPL